MSIKITDLIAPRYHDAHRRIRESANREFFFYGGRGSGKSSVISIEIFLELFRDRKKNALILRRNANTLSSSVFAQMLWAADRLDIGKTLSVRKVPPLIELPTGQQILFRGLDDPLKLKSIKTREGHIGILWFEELTEMSDQDVRSVIQSAIRGGENSKIFYSFNPSPFKTNWANRRILEKDSAYRISSSFLDVPRDWLGDAFYEQADLLQRRDPDAYRNEYLGEVTGAGGLVFRNVVTRPIDEQERRETTDRYLVGIDWGFAVSPLVILVAGWNKTRREIRIFEEFWGRNIQNRDAAEALRSMMDRYGVNGVTVYADSAEPKSIDFMRRNNLPVSPCVKGSDSIRYGVRWLQGLSSIVIDETKAPKTAEQFANYEYQKNRMGEWVDEYPMRDDDAIDCLRYAVTAISTPGSPLFS